MSVTSSVPNYKSVNDTANWILPFPSLSLLSRSPVMGWFFWMHKQVRNCTCVSPQSLQLLNIYSAQERHTTECVCQWVEISSCFILFHFLFLQSFSGTFHQNNFLPLCCLCSATIACVNLPPSLVSIQPLNPMSPIHKYWEYTRFR